MTGSNPVAKMAAGPARPDIAPEARAWPSCLISSSHRAEGVQIVRVLHGAWRRPRGVHARPRVIRNRPVSNKVSEIGNGHPATQPRAGPRPGCSRRTPQEAARRVAEFFTTQINNDHTRKAYMNAARRFAQWCAARGIGELAAVEPIHVAAFIKQLQRELSALTVKQHLAALRMLLTGGYAHVITLIPAHAVRRAN